MITGTQNVALLDYIRDVANDEVIMDEDHYHLLEDAQINPKDLIDEVPHELIEDEEQQPENVMNEPTQQAPEQV